MVQMHSQCMYVRRNHLIFVMIKKLSAVFVFLIFNQQLKAIKLAEIEEIIES